MTKMVFLSLLLWTLCYGGLVEATDPICYTPSTFPVSPVRPLPPALQCYAATDLIYDEPKSYAVSIITSNSSLVPHHGYLYPHSWTSEECSVTIALLENESVDYASLRDLSKDARLIVRYCRSHLHKWGGWTVGGVYGKIKVIVTHREVPSSLPGEGTGSWTNMTLKETLSAATS